MEGTGYGILAAFGLGIVQKHVFKRLPNWAIPWTNLILTSGVGIAMTGDVKQGIEFGVQAAGGATLGHSMLKQPVKKVTGRSI